MLDVEELVAVDEDPEFGRAYAGMGVAFGNLRREAAAEASYQQAFQHLDVGRRVAGFRCRVLAGRLGLGGRFRRGHRRICIGEEIEGFRHVGVQPRL